MPAIDQSRAIERVDNLDDYLQRPSFEEMDLECLRCETEVALIEQYVGGPLFADVVGYMAQRGLFVHDICTIFRNTPDQSMNEADVIFARRGTSFLPGPVQ